MRRPAWVLFPLGYAVVFVAAWPGVLDADDGSGLPWLGTFALGLPWSALAIAVTPGDGMTTAQMIGLAASGSANAIAIALFARRSVNSD